MSEPARDERNRIALAILFALALLPRLIHLWTIRDSPFFSILYIDPLMYDEWAQRIAGGELLSEKPFFLDPLYPYFLGAIFAIFGHSYAVVLAIQAFLGALVAPLVFLATRDWFDRRTAWVAGSIAALYLPGIYFGGLIMKPGLSVFFSALLLWLFSRGLRAPRPLGHWILTGAVFGMAALTRGNLLLVIPVVVGWMLLSRPVERFHERGRWVAVGGLLGGAALLLLLPAAHNYKVGGEWILTTANSGANFYIGNNPTNDSGEYQQLPFIRANPKYEQLDFSREAMRRAGRETMSDREISRFWFDESRKWIVDQPLDWSALLWKKVRGFWGAYEIPDSVDYLLYREYAPVLQLPLPGFGLLGPLCLTGGLLALRRRGWPRLLLLFVSAYAATVIVFFVFSRFRMVLAPAFYVLAAYAAVEIVRRWRDCCRAPGSKVAALIPTLLFVGAFAFVNLPVRARVDTWGYRVAAAVGLPTRAETSAQGHYNLGLAFAGKARDAGDRSESVALLERAEDNLRRTLELRGENAFATDRVELGKVLARLERNAEALEVYRRAESVEPRDYKIPHAIGLLAEREGDAQLAADAFARALRLEPRHIASAIRLGYALLELERFAEAEELFRNALRYDSGNRRANEGLQLARAGAPEQ